MINCNWINSVNFSRLSLFLYGTHLNGAPSISGQLVSYRSDCLRRLHWTYCLTQFDVIVLVDAGTFFVKIWKIFIFIKILIVSFKSALFLSEIYPNLEFSPDTIMFEKDPSLEWNTTDPQLFSEIIRILFVKFGRNWYIYIIIVQISCGYSLNLKKNVLAKKKHIIRTSHRSSSSLTGSLSTRHVFKLLHPQNY